VFGDSSVPAYYQVNAELIAGTQYSAVIVRIGYFIQNYNKSVVFFVVIPEALKEFFEGSFGAKTAFVYCQGYTPVKWKGNVCMTGILGAIPPLFWAAKALVYRGSLKKIAMP
jgi:hypothetical protein